MAIEEKISAIKNLLEKYVTERVKGMTSDAMLRAVDVEGKWADFLQKWLEDYHGEEKVPHYVVRELVKHIEAITKPYNVPYVQEVTEGDWDGEAPNLTIVIPAHTHNLLGCIEVNAYRVTEGGYDLVTVDLSVDFGKNITIKSAARFSGKIEAFSSVGETPELQHRQPVYTFNGESPDDTGNITIERLSEVILEGHNDDPDAHAYIRTLITSAINAIAEHNTSPEAHEDIRDTIAGNLEEAKGYAEAYAGDLRDEAKDYTNDLLGEERAVRQETDEALTPKSKLTAVLIDAEFSDDATSVKLTLSVYNAELDSSSTSVLTVPMASGENPGAMPKEMYTSLTQALADILVLQQQGGKYIGVSFATKADLDAYVFADNNNPGDFTFVLDDETREDATTRYIISGEKTPEDTREWDFGYVINYDPVGLATTLAAGLVKGTEAVGGNGGKIFVEADGTMSVIGWDGIVTAVGDLSSLSTTAKNNLVAAINELKSSMATVAFTGSYLDLSHTPNIPPTIFTFIVDSDAALAAWANNAAGNDYTSVLIKPGTWTSSKEVNLTNAGTKTVTGMTGSKLFFTSVSGLRYITAPTSAEYWMTGVNVKLNHANASYNFNNCANLTNCTSDRNAGINFQTCTNLLNCTSSSSTGIAFGYSNCANLKDTISFCSNGFDNCTNLTSCDGKDGGIGTGYTFNNCKKMTNCTGMNAFNIFKNCTNLMSCSGINSYREDFDNCRIMSFCKGTYKDCYMHAEGTDIPVGDTAAGGWNEGGPIVDEGINADTVDGFHVLSYTPAEFNSIATKDENTLYFITL
jgi:hypothetical protein